MILFVGGLALVSVGVVFLGTPERFVRDNFCRWIFSDFTRRLALKTLLRERTTLVARSMFRVVNDFNVLSVDAIDASDRRL